MFQLKIWCNFGLNRRNTVFRLRKLFYFHCLICWVNLQGHSINFIYEWSSDGSDHSEVPAMDRAPSLTCEFVANRKQQLDANRMSAKPVVGRVTTDGPFWLSNSDFLSFLIFFLRFHSSFSSWLWYLYLCVLAWKEHSCSLQTWVSYVINVKAMKWNFF